MKAIIHKAIYGLKSTANSFYHLLGSKLDKINFKPSRIDGAFWYRLREDGSGYDYIASHVDDLMIAAEDVESIVMFLKSEFIIKDEALPDDNLGLNMKVTEDGEGWALTTKPYLKQCLESVRNIVGQEKLSRQSTPTKSTWHPENYADAPLDAEGVHDYRSMIGMAQWLIALGRVDIHHAVSTLARYSHIATHNHFDDFISSFRVPQ